MKKREFLMPFGRFPALVLKLTFPLVLIQAAYLVFFISTRDAYTLLSSADMLSSIFESVLVSLILSVGGSLLLEYTEKKNKQ